jgi:curved DNA-binding protein CbpA
MAGPVRWREQTFSATLCTDFPRVDRDTAYRTLGLDPSASPEGVRRAYRDLVKVWHPDRFAHDPGLQAKASAQLQQINEAYELLTDSTAQARARVAEPRATPSPPAPSPPSPPPAVSSPPPRRRRWSSSGDRPGVASWVFPYLFVCLAAVLALIIYSERARFNRRAPAGTRTAAASPPRRGMPGLTGSPSASRGPADSDRPLRTLPNGTAVLRPLASGHGTLIIDNPTARDAVVALLDREEPQRAVFVAARHVATMKNVAAGTFAVRYSTGLDWDEDAREFGAERQDAQFVSPVTFTESEDDPGAGVITLRLMRPADVRASSNIMRLGTNALILRPQVP